MGARVWCAWMACMCADQCDCVYLEHIAGCIHLMRYRLMIWMVSCTSYQLGVYDNIYRSCICILLMCMRCIFSPVLMLIEWLSSWHRDIWYEGWGFMMKCPYVCATWYHYAMYTSPGYWSSGINEQLSSICVSLGLTSLPAGLPSPLPMP